MGSERVGCGLELVLLCQEIESFQRCHHEGKPCLQCHCVPVFLHTLISIFWHSELKGAVSGGCSEGGEQRECSMLVFLPCQSCAGARRRLSPAPPCNPSLPLLSLLSSGVRNSGRQQGSGVQGVSAVGAGGEGGQDPGQHQEESRLLRELLLSSPGHRCLPAHPNAALIPLASWSSPVPNSLFLAS